MKGKKIFKPFGALLIIYALITSVFVCTCAAYSKKEESTLAVLAQGESEILIQDAVAECDRNDGVSTTHEIAPVLSENAEVASRLWELFVDKKKSSDESRMLCVGGDVFGVKIRSKNVTVTESIGIPAIRAGDVILSVNGKAITCAEQVRKIVSESGGESITVRALHRGEEIGIEIRPSLVDGEYKIGLSLRDGAVGIGTVTFIDPKTGMMGGLGHGICDSESGDIIEMQSGEISGVILGGVHKGECGKPGELSGILTSEVCGELCANTAEGVFAVMTGDVAKGGRLLPIGSRDELHEGEATIISTVKNGKSAEYKIEIESIDRTSTGSKSFRIKVTDEALKAITGGIVRGMSGSPIIQDGKLVGAVTHVMVANPTEGYGIFIENMLNAAQQQALPKAA